MRALLVEIWNDTRHDAEVDADTNMIATRDTILMGHIPY